VLELRPAQREPFWSAWVRRPAPNARSTSCRRACSRLAPEPPSVPPGRSPARPRIAPQGPAARALRFLSGLFSLQRRVESAFLSSGAATQLADAALAGENTRELAGRIARIARRLSGAAGVAVHLRTAAGLQMLGCDGEPCSPELAALGVETGRVEWGEDSAAVPLCLQEHMVGALSLQFRSGVRDCVRCGRC